ncbi:hypothetical protein M422DRAFT_32703 [Sphaerobolus stellatus SS14]|uniref:ML-like domain-containing protein n=1 Tax=Sphaerobolus stellatus (strain SS14) TaxID=990650 RepID=A0A0C9VDH2_SPHS4|nr:hypothetical protein M422DRAFT_32703 [Sphaerobolus stellatus SS14]
MTSFFAWTRYLIILTLTQLIFFSRSVHAIDTLFTSSITYCSPPEAILIQEFTISYIALNNSVSFNISAASVKPDLRVRANIFLNVYGMQPVNLSVDFCDVFSGAFCPLPTTNFSGAASIPLPNSIDVSSKLPGIAYKIPDLEAFAQITLTDLTTNEVAACIQATLSNGWSSRQSSVSYVTGAIGVFAGLSALVHTLLPSTPLAPASYYNLPSLAPARFVDYVLLIQQIAITGFLHLNLPLVYRAFTVNFSWSVYLLTSTQAFQNAIDRLRHRTGGSLADGAESPIAFVDRGLSPYNSQGNGPTNLLAQFNKAFLASHNMLAGRDATTDSSANAGPPATVTSNDEDILPAGIPLYVNSLHIGTANAFMSVFFTVLIGFVIGATVLGIIYAILTFIVTRVKGNKWGWADVMHSDFKRLAASCAIICGMIVLSPILIFGFFQWTLGDSWLSSLLAAICIILIVGPLGYAAVKTLLLARRESPEALYGIAGNLTALRTFLVPFRWERYYFFAVGLVAAFVKSVFIGFAKTDGLAQVIGLLIVEITVFVLMCILKPHRSRGADVLGIYLSLTRVATAGLMIPFIEKLHIKPIPRVAIGFVVMVIFSVAVIIMVVNIFMNFGTGLVWRRHKNDHLGSSSSVNDIEKTGERDIPPEMSESPVTSTMRPGNPTPSTSFSHESEHLSGSRHNPRESQLVSPGFTIPSIHSETDRASISETDYGSPPPSARTETSYATPASPLTGQSSRFSSPPSTGRSSRFHSRRTSEQLPTHQEGVSA